MVFNNSHCFRIHPNKLKILNLPSHHLDICGIWSYHYIIDDVSVRYLSSHRIYQKGRSFR